MLKQSEIKTPLLIKETGLKFATSNSKCRRRFGLFKCVCGKEFEAILYSVKTGNTKSCGCHNIKQIIKRNSKHGLSNHRLNSIWKHMLQRTTNSKNKDFIAYGVRGIQICNEWSNDFMSFYNWAISNGYEEGLTIDRIDNDGNYEPLNCRWTTQIIQSRNTRILRSTNKSGYKGVCFKTNINKYSATICINYKKIHIGYFQTSLEAAKEYDKYVIENNLEHTMNGV